MIIENTGTYMIAADQIGFAIKNVGNRKEVYLQGDDATALREALDKPLTPAQVNAICSEYDEIMN